MCCVDVVVIFICRGAGQAVTIRTFSTPINCRSNNCDQRLTAADTSQLHKEMADTFVNFKTLIVEIADLQARTAL